MRECIYFDNYKCTFDLTKEVPSGYIMGLDKRSCDMFDSTETKCSCYDDKKPVAKEIK